MDPPPAIPAEDATASVPTEAPASAPVLWHAGWALGVGVCAGVMLLVLGQVSAASAAALAIGALPGFIGFLWRPKGAARRALLIPWLLCGGAAAALTGGISGPLAAWCLTPVLAALPLGLAFEGVAAALLAIAAASFAQSAGIAPGPPEGLIAVWLGAIGLASLAAGGAGALMLAQGRDRIEQRRLEGEHAALRLLLADLPAPIAAFDRDGRLIAAYGPPVSGLPAGWLADGLVEAAGPADRSRLVASIADALDHGSGDAGFAPAAAPDRRLTLKFRRTADKGLLAAIHEVPAEPQTRGAELWASRGQLETLLRGHPDLIALAEPDGRIVPLSVYGHPPEGLTPAGLARSGLVQIAEPADQSRIVEALKFAVETGHAGVVFALKDQPARRVSMSLRGTRDGRLVACIRGDGQSGAAQSAEVLAAAAQSAANAEAAARRMAELETARAEAEAARDRAEAVARARSRFLANMSHELRTPLNAIMGFSDIMRAAMFGPLTPKYAEYAELIHESGRHLLDLINDILDMSKIEAERYELSREAFDVREALSAALRLLRLQADDAGVQLRGVLPAKALMVDADRRAIKQIVLNLVSNALKFTPPEGSVTLTAQAAGGALEIVVADTGVGIAAEDLERLGRPFEQAGDAEGRTQGSGLGLSLVKAFAGLHGGEMTIESTLGEGTAVTVRLPVLVPEAELNHPPSGAPPVPADQATQAQASEDDRMTRPSVMSGPTSWPSMPLNSR